MAKRAKEKAEKPSALAIYKDSKGNIEFRADVKKDTIWATLNQIADLFDVQKPAISKHLKNIYQSKELEIESTVSKMETVQIERNRAVKRHIEYYNLDAILAVGYRVNSKKATTFRIWATKTLKKYLVQGYVINEKRILDAADKLQELKTAISFLQEKSGHELLAGQEQEILSLLSAYSKTLTLLEKYDKNELVTAETEKPVFRLEYEEAKAVIQKLKTELAAEGEAEELFGIEPEHKFESLIKNLYQTFGGKELYKTVGEKAANLLYLTIKDHPFADGNKRSASFLFVYFLDRNRFLYRESGERKINDNALVALALLVAVSDPKEKEVIIKIITNLIK